MIKFPGINLELNISKNVLEIGNITITWYALIIVLAFIIALVICKKNNGKYEIKYNDIIDLSIYLIPISIISARLYYILFSLEYYIYNPLDLFNLKTGGLAIYGGIIGGIITIYIFCKKRNINLLDLTDYIVPSLALGQAIGRWGNFINIEAYGYETTLPWRMGIIENGIYKEVHPTFLYESIITFILFFLLTILQNKRKFKGEITYIYLIVYSFSRMILEEQRIDSLMLFNVKISQILSMLIFVIFCFILYIKILKNKKINHNVKK